MKKYPYLTELIVFMLLLALVLAGMYSIVRYKNVGSGGGMDNFYKTEVPIDVIIYGSSHAACTVNNGIFWQDYGIASYTLSAASQSMDATYYFLQESIAVNKPKVALVETYLLTDWRFALDSYYRSALTSRFSSRFLFYTLNVVKDNEMDRQTAENMLLRMPIVHSRYKELEKGDFVNSSEYIRGYRGDNSTSPISEPQRTEVVSVLTEETLECIDNMINLCQKEDVELIFFNAPYQIDEESFARQNSLKDYVEGKGCSYIGFNHEFEKYNIDFGMDFRDEGHLNDAGAEKVTRALAEYIKANCQVEDRRGDSGYEMWDKHLKYLADKSLRYRLNDSKDLGTYMDCLCEIAGEKTLIISLNGNHRAQGDEIYRPWLEKLGIDTKDYEKGGVWVIREGETLYYSDGETDFVGYYQLGKNTDLNVFKSEEDEFVHISLGDHDFSPDCNGISVLVYDEECEYLVHAMKVNVYESVEVVDIELDE